MAFNLKRKLSSEIKTVTKTDVEKTDVLISEDQKKYLKARKRLVTGQFINQGSDLVNSNFNYYISSPEMTSHYNDNYQTPESNNNPGVVAEWRPHPNVYHQARIPVAFVAPQMRTRLHPQVPLQVPQPVMVPEVAPTFPPNLYGYPWTHRVPHIQETPVQEPNIQEPIIHEPNTQEPYTQEPYTQEPYIQERYIQQPYSQHLYMQQPYVQQPYVQQQYVQQPYAQQPYAHQLYIQQPYAQQPYAQQPYTQQLYAQHPYVQQPNVEQSYVQQPYIQEPSMPKPYIQEPYLKEHHVQEPCTQSPYLTEPHFQESYTTTDVINDLSKCTLEEIASPGQTTENVIDKSKHTDPFEAYLKLPKDLFPTANKLGLDPNPFIDQCCKLRDVDDKVPWILDLELGAPISPTPRTIAIYDIKCNSIRCKQEPDIIHPGFQRCNSDFQKLILRYYNCIIYSWYKGYTNFYKEKSLQNFQAWLLLPMQTYGLCWP